MTAATGFSFRCKVKRETASPHCEKVRNDLPPDHEIVCDDFPMFHRQPSFLTVQNLLQGKLAQFNSWLTFGTT